MSTVFPGTTIETSKLHQGCSKTLFDGIFAAGGITLSQVSIMTGLEPYIIQNWIKRKFLFSPIGRVYSREQFARIVIINMLRDTLQIDKICGLFEIIEGSIDTDKDDLIADEELYHRYVDMISEQEISPLVPSSVMIAAEQASLDFLENNPHSRKQLIKILQIMFYAHSAHNLRTRADEILSTID